VRNYWIAVHFNHAVDCPQAPAFFNGIPLRFVFELRSNPDRRTQSCVFQHEPGDLYALAQPATITLPDGHAVPIVPGNPITQPQSVTLDSDGSTYPGQASTAASLLWGAATDGGPFSGLDAAAVGDTITLHQAASAASPVDCTQQWRIVRIFTPPVAPWSEPTLLRLVGFAPQGASGPNVQFYVDAVPA
jgi:hypothetical protein